MMEYNKELEDYREKNKEKIHRQLKIGQFEQKGIVYIKPPLSSSLLSQLDKMYPMRGWKQC